MSTCPKCGGTRIIGPTFVKRLWQEALRYECIDCGYVEHGPTLEQQREPAEKNAPR